MLVLGFVVAPYMISVFMLGERAAPAERVGAAMTLLAGATGIGYAVGSAGAGRLADAYGHPGAFAVTVGAGLAAALLAAVGQPLLRRVRHPEREPGRPDLGRPEPAPVPMPGAVVRPRPRRGSWGRMRP